MTVAWLGSEMWRRTPVAMAPETVTVPGSALERCVLRAVAEAPETVTVPGAALLAEAWYPVAGAPESVTVP